MKSLIITIAIIVSIFMIVFFSGIHKNNHFFQTAFVRDSLEKKESMDTIPNNAISTTKVDSMASISEGMDTNGISDLQMLWEAEPTLDAVERMSINYGICLDKGTQMLHCTKEYLFQIDRLSDMQYDILLSNLTPNEQTKLKDNQTRWLKDKEEKFKEIDIKRKKDLDEWGYGQDYKMLVLHNKAAVLKERLIWLINYK
jgi:uncharacterized protein YecT (DUF1311 family)